MARKKTPRPPSKERIERLKAAMRAEPGTRHLVNNVESTARNDPAMFELLESHWAPTTVVDDEPAEGRAGGGIDFAAVDRIDAAIAAFKRSLRDVVNQNGGVTAVAARMGITQPSLSRMLSQETPMPRRSTLHVLARALENDDA